MIGYAVQANPVLASFRLRVAIPRQHIGLPSAVGVTGKPTFFYKNGNPSLARAVKTTGVVYDVVNDHFHGKNAADYHAMCSAADIISCSSEYMRDVIERQTGRAAVVIDDPYENAEDLPACRGTEILWFGHSANIGSLRPYTDVVGATLVICSNGVGVEWTPASEAECLRRTALVLMTGYNQGASSNRIVKALRAGRFVICPNPCESWKQFSPYMWVGDVQKGIEWAFNHREEACHKIMWGQEYVRDRFSPEEIGRRWRNLFDSILDAGSSEKQAGPE